MPRSSPALLAALSPIVLAAHGPSDRSAVPLMERAPVRTAQQVVPHAQAVTPAIHVVTPGETLRGVGNRSGAGSEAIAKANGLAPPYLIRPGQKLVIPGGRYHLVAEGETGIAIAAAYGLAWRRIIDLNGLAEPYMLRSGQRLLLPDEAPRPASTVEERAAAFRIDIGDVPTDAQPALAKGKIAPAGTFAWPASGRILSRFGPGASGSRNNGIDIAVPTGTPIRAAAEGVVAYAGDKLGMFGGLVLINHGGGWVSAYGHASRVDVVRGQKVSRRQIIGLSGDTGYASRPKLHFELRKDRVPVNPIQQLPVQAR